ncbi:MAG: sugar O-acyltransferase, sialic acid O-acetyltransferase NeuD family [Planctomycetota bacterium]|nr:sugar O-acyltransferase, sialic acid O-acetyltransferase NeuD family [Planctomycetota bacterium]
MSRPLIILGSGGGAHDVLDLVEALNRVDLRWELLGFLDDVRPAGSHYLGLEILGGLRDAPSFGACTFVNAIGSDKNYRRRSEILGATGMPADRFATLVHPGASVSPRATLGRGVSVHFGASVGGNASIGDQAMLGPGSIVGHDCIVEDYAILAPGAVVSGFVQVGRAAYLGARCAIRQQLRVGDECLVGIGAIVIRDVRRGAIVVGNPARPLRHADVLVGSEVASCAESMLSSRVTNTHVICEKAFGAFSTSRCRISEP